MTADKIVTIEGAVVQHGRLNDRIYVMHLNTADTGRLTERLDDMARENGYGKIFAKIPASRWKNFKLAGYTSEAVVPGLFSGTIDGLFVAKYFNPERLKGEQRPWFDPQDTGPRPLSRIESVSRPAEACTPSDAIEMGMIYRRVFKSYPFPIQKPDYLKCAMKKGVRYGCIRIEGRIVALAAAEIDIENKNCEMTDFATMPKWRGQGFAQTLLGHMESTVRKGGIKTAYTIARATSPGMSSVFKNSAYHYGGLLINNSHISGRLQSMAVWYKHL